MADSSDAAHIVLRTCQQSRTNGWRRPDGTHWQCSHESQSNPRQHCPKKGGGIYVVQGWAEDVGSTFVQNYASTGGGLSCDTSLVQLTNTSFNKNTASLDGGGLWLQLCPDFVFSGLSFKQNTANFSGGATFVQQTGVCAICKQYNNTCTYTGNQAAFGSDTGTGPQQLLLNYVKKTKSVNQLSEIILEGTLYDAFGHVVTQSEDTIVLSAMVEMNKNVELQGRFEDTFEGGKASLDFFIVPSDTVIHTNANFDLTVRIGTNIYPFNQTFNVRFHNSIYAPKAWTIGINSAFGAVGIISVLVTALLMWRYHESAIIRGATPPFLVVILFGCFLLSASIIVLPFMPQKVSCLLLPWLLHLSFVLILAPITGKTWRIYMIFYMASKKFKRFNFTTWKLALFFIILPLVVVVAYLLTWTFLQKDWTQWEVETNGENKEYCSLESLFLTISLTCGAVLLLWLVRLAIGVKGVPKNFNESFWLGAAIYTLALVMLFMIPISVINSVPPEVKQTLGGIAAWIALEAVLAFIFWRKYYMIWFHSEEMNTRKSTTSPEDSGMSNTESSGMAASDLSSDRGSKSGRSTSPSATGQTIKGRPTM
ncbi:hypothetical protein RFI_25488 [Reticulomyxa filosa]|uniref:G-protein coupled receptors family 3 profile domain-containing protein n=1 Tax=Reticulomyxa filosa TaxID=46433 RepID=X6ME33_RETFI|nr:hypothetical protein RFI_25488 [Reticulomyxa filosa]|eukprot:ETO11886.1 hypothetical protein RFI_25488 [Reticulomyxa filosa]